jgi:hypothetical protein
MRAHLQDVVLCYAGDDPVIICVPAEVADFAGVPSMDEQQLWGTILSILRRLHISKAAANTWSTACLHGSPTCSDYASHTTLPPDTPSQGKHTAATVTQGNNLHIFRSQSNDAVRHWWMLLGALD